jgi:hypothetical protein
MRPTITEQLRAIRRILNDVIVPEVNTTYPTDILKNVLFNLQELEANWMRWTAHLEWENEQLQKLTLDARARVDTALQQQIDGAAALAPADHFDYDGACAYNDALRTCVTEIIRRARTDAALTDDAARITAVLKEGIQRRV